MHFNSIFIFFMLFHSFLYTYPSSSSSSLCELLCLNNIKHKKYHFYQNVLIKYFNIILIIIMKYLPIYRGVAWIGMHWTLHALIWLGMTYIVINGIYTYISFMFYTSLIWFYVKLYHTRHFYQKFLKRLNIFHSFFINLFCFGLLSLCERKL